MSVLLSWLSALLRGARDSSPNGLTPVQIHAEIDTLARQHLGVSGDEAIRQLDAGAYDGTAIEVELKALRFLLGDAHFGNHARDSLSQHPAV
jgi:hypothetical protein